MITALTQFTTAVKTATQTVPDTTPVTTPNVVQTIISSSTLGNIFNASTFTPADAVTSVQLLGNVINPVLPVSKATDALKAAGAVFAASTDAASYLAQTWSPLKVTGTTKNAYTLESTAGNAKLTVTEATAGNAPFAGNGTVNESVLFTGTNNDKLAINSSTVSFNVADKENTEFGSSVDSLAQTREVVFTNKDISSAYKFAAKHDFTEAQNGNQAFADATDKAYNYKDANLTIASQIKTAVKAVTDFTSGAEKLVSTKAAAYVYDNNLYNSTAGRAVKVDYSATETQTSTTTGAITTNTIITQLPKFTVTDSVDGFKLDAKGTATHRTSYTDIAGGTAAPVTVNVNNVTATSRNKTSETYDVKNTGLSLSASNNDYSLVVKKFLTDGTITRLLNLGSPSLDDSQNFSTSFANIAADQSSAIKSNFITAGTSSAVNAATTTIKGTEDNDEITVKTVTGGIAQGNGGDDVIIGNIGNDDLAGGFGNDTLKGGDGNDSLSGGNGNDTLNGENGADTLVGQAGDDVLNGGAGADVFTGARTAFTGDTIQDFTTGEDKLRFMLDYSKTPVVKDAGGKDTTTGITIDTNLVDKLDSKVNGQVIIDAKDAKNVVVFGNNAGDSDNQGKFTANATSDSNDFRYKIGAATVAAGDLQSDIIGSKYNDTITGGAGEDTIFGGAGADSLTGGAGADVFAYGKTLSDAVGDKIIGFISGTDKIDLRSIDANSATATVDLFKFVTTAFDADATGQVRFDAATNTLQASTNADATPELSINLVGVTAITADDILGLAA